MAVTTWLRWIGAGLSNDLKRSRHLVSRFAGWALVLAPLAVATGVLGALFLQTLKCVTLWRFHHGWILWGLPVAGVAVALAYRFVTGLFQQRGRTGAPAPFKAFGDGAPLVMVPMAFGAATISHLFGASVGREGTALQMAGGLADGLARLCRMDARRRKLIILSGVSAGFGAVFGTPVAGTLFGLEVTALGEMGYGALLPCAFTALVADQTCRVTSAYIGFERLDGHMSFQPFYSGHWAFTGPDPWLMAKVGVAGLAFGVVSRLYAGGIRQARALSARLCAVQWLRPALGGVATLALVWLCGSDDFLGLGIVAPQPHGASVVNFFGQHHYAWAWAWKLLFTLVALGCGFRGGEVTPMFFIGAGLGNALAPWLGAPTPLLAAAGFAAVFAGAANTPLTCTVMAAEIFGSANLAYYAMACIIAYAVSGHDGLYGFQRVMTPKYWYEEFAAGLTVEELRARQQRAHHGLARYGKALLRHNKGRWIRF
ncbi:voltage-gated chloride channel protein [Formicincola oecophyllae]|uniref:Voltage-gated chloride channel protein n=2 Tax=Formicincola oecophyllae TaxID=2558361 RepID=A0A4Y6UA37_9PROT|nr:voltage-gated chloride channel protein [Formicincola oecophyllae]